MKALRGTSTEGSCLGEVVMETKFSESELEDILYADRSDVISVLKTTVKELIRNHPLICLGLTFALGVALGSILVESRKD